MINGNISLVFGPNQFVCEIAFALSHGKRILLILKLIADILQLQLAGSSFGIVV